jgi:hypothetical protein
MSLLQIAPLPIPALPPERGSDASLAVIGVVTLSIVALLAAGLTFLHRYRRPDAATLHARVAEAIAGEVDLARVDVVTTTGPSASVPASVTLDGVVASAATRDRVVRLAEAAARRVEPRVTIIDRLTVEAKRAA